MSKPRIKPKLLRLPDVCKMTGAAKSTIYYWMKRGDFPSPVKLGQRAVAWRTSDVHKWINSRVEG